VASENENKIGTSFFVLGSGKIIKERSPLSLGKLDTSRAFLIIVNDVIDTTAHWIAPHQPSVEGLQQFGHHNHILHSRIEPPIICLTSGCIFL
jgi:hypothetical protein